MKLWLALLTTLAASAAGMAAPAAAQSPGQPAAQAPAPAAMQARSDSLARAALAATVAGKRVFVDVRTPEEFAAGHLAGAVSIPLAELEQRWSELKAYDGRQIVLYCRAGVRAGMALQVATRHGIANAVNGGGYESLRKLLEPAS